MTPPDPSGRPRCSWAETASPIDQAYHDREWGVPVRDQRGLFELLTLEGAQAGLSWSTILRRRAGYRRVFADFDAERLARWNDRDIEQALGDAGIIRHRGKITSVVTNAQALLVLRQPDGGLVDHVWSFVNGQPLQPNFRRGQVPAVTERAEALSKDLRRRGFRFLGPTTIYAFMQAAGLTNDHTVDCYRWADLTDQ